MKTIVEPKEYIDKLWGKQRIRNGDTYRMMRYVLRVDHEGKVLLHNVVTGKLVVLNQDETEALEKIPLRYEPILEQLVSEHYLVPEEYDEHQEVKKLKTILNKLEDAQMSEETTHYTILPTTACNARCYYCFEKGSKLQTMSEETANELIRYIDSHCTNSRNVRLSWFGGEPTVASCRIDQVSKGILKRGIRYRSEITTNGFLMDERMADKAKNLWHLTKAMICFDGTEQKYNYTKAYINVTSSPYQQVIRNIGFLIERGIVVNVRMNYDIGNYDDFQLLVEEIKGRYGLSPYLCMRVHPIVGAHIDHNGRLEHAPDDWFEEKNVELGEIARNAGMMESYASSLFYLSHKGCQANHKHSVTITPNGDIVRCPEKFGDDQITGNIRYGILNQSLVEAWKETIEFAKCKNCVLYPYCYRLKLCEVQDRCTFVKEAVLIQKNTMLHAYACNEQNK